MASYPSHQHTRKNDISDDCIWIEEMNAVISALEISLYALRSERMVLQARLDAYKYPVLTLPNEIVSEIFIDLLPQYPTCPPATGLSSPASLGHICRKWREIAFSTAALWRAISSTLTEKKTLESLFHLLQTSLRLSSSCKLPIALIDSDRVEDRTVSLRMISQFAQEIIASCGRWEHLTFDFPIEAICLLNGHMPFLRSLKLGCSRVDSLGTPIVIFGDAPQLRYLLSV
ncbi:hypothetical protein C8R43DRAFT_1049406 [Mycena crocata]|nr:hypothetical protein C8R43DRAFT_1049406 [Mycena crocata]